MHSEVITIRVAHPSDASDLLEIYAPYVRDTAISFEYEVPTTLEFAQRIQNTLLTYPYLIAEQKGVIVGYAYLSRFHSRPAYDWASEVSIYVKREVKGQGIGRALYEAIEAIAHQQGIRNLYACIAYPLVDDQYLTRDSVYFHEHLGYQKIGHFHSCGYKFQTWYDMIWMEKHLSKDKTPVMPFVPFKNLVMKG